MQIKTENYTGADCSGSSGGSNRVLTLTNTDKTLQNGFTVHVAGLALSITSEYTVTHSSSSTEIILLNPVWDDSNIIISYTLDADVAGASGTGDDFNNGPLSDFGVVATRTPVTVATDYSGNKIYTDGTDETINIVISPYKEKYDLDKSGLNKSYDAMAFVASDVTINKYDKITHDSKVYRVDNISPRDFAGTGSFQLAMLFYAEDE